METANDVSLQLRTRVTSFVGRFKSVDIVFYRSTIDAKRSHNLSPGEPPDTSFDLGEALYLRNRPILFLLPIECAIDHLSEFRSG